MSDIVRSLILGIVQGLTEFLPVSSSGHLEILNHLLGSSNSVDSDLTMVVLVHAGTALSILYVYRNDILDILRDIIQLKWSPQTRLALEIIVSMLPALVIGLAFEDKIDELFSGGIWMVGLSLIFTGVILWVTPNLKETQGSIGWSKALLIGIAQAIAIMPGISRSGMTICAALMLGAGKKEAARFSFLMVLPVILGKVLLDLISGEVSVSGSATLPILVALVSSFVVGVLACTWMIRIVQNSSLRYFSVYCVVLGLITTVLYFYA